MKYEFVPNSDKHRGFAFVEFELAEDAAAAIDNMNESELCGRTLRVNLAKPLKITPNRYDGHLFLFAFLCLFTINFCQEVNAACRC